MVSPNPKPEKHDLSVRAVFEGGVFRPLGRVNLPESTDVELTVHRPGTFVPISDQEWTRRLDEVRAKLQLDLKGWTFNRDELYERD